MLASLTPVRIVAAAFVAVAVLFAIGWATREDPADKPYLRLLGGGFIFNYRISEVNYGFTALVERPLPTGSIIEASFEDPGGGEALVVSTRVGTDTEHYALQSPPVRGVEAGRRYKVAIRVLDRDGASVLWTHETSFASRIADTVLPEKPLTIGPGYARNPEANLVKSR